MSLWHFWDVYGEEKEDWMFPMWKSNSVFFKRCRAWLQVILIRLMETNLQMGLVEAPKQCGSVVLLGLASLGLRASRVPGGRKRGLLCLKGEGRLRRVGGRMRWREAGNPDRKMDDLIWGKNAWATHKWNGNLRGFVCCTFSFPYLKIYHEAKSH